MHSVPPRLRSDLEIKKLPAADGPVYVLKDPVSGEFYRLRRAEYFVARQFDGERSLEEIRERAEKKFGAKLPQETLAAFVKVLFKSQLLDDGGAAVKDRARRGGPVGGSLLYLRFKLWDPDRVLERLDPYLRFLFTPWFLALSAALILLAIGTTIGNRYALGREIADLAGLASIPFIVVVLFALVSVHEFVHGLACKRYGGSVHEMGFMLLYFQPALYCNVSDAWLFPERRHRLLVGFAGPYAELTLWAAATLLWRFTDHETWLHIVSLVVAGSAGIKTLLNFNPLLKFDGYYLLSDLLDIPNLRDKSFAYLRARAKALFHRKPEEAHDLPRRLRRIYVSYGVSAAAFSYVALAFAMVIVGDYFIESRGPLSVLLACAVVAAQMRSRIGRLVEPKKSASSRTERREASGKERTKPQPALREAEKEEAAAMDTPRKDAIAVESPGKAAVAVDSRSRALAVRPSGRAAAALAPRHEAAAAVPSGRDAWRRERPMPRALVLALRYGALAALAAVVLFVPRLELRIAGPFNVLPEENADVRAPLEQIIEEIYVDEGDIVKPGDPIARLDARPLKAELATTEAAIEEARAILRKLQVGPTKAEIAVARAGVDKGEDSLMYATKRVERLEMLYRQGLVSQKELEDAQEQAAAASNNRTEAGSRLHLLEVGTRPEEIAATQARLEQLEAERGYIEDQMTRLHVVSPVAGIVATPTRQLRELRRQLLKKGDLILKVYDVSTVTAQIFVSERELDGIEVGQRVELRARAYPGQTFNGTVTSIATSAQGEAGVTGGPGVFTSGSTDPNKSVIVTTRIDNRSLLLKPEMTGQAKVFCGPRTIADLVARRAALTFRVALWSWW